MIRNGRSISPASTHPDHPIVPCAPSTSPTSQNKRAPQNKLLTHRGQNQRGVPSSKSTMITLAPIVTDDPNSGKYGDWPSAPKRTRGPCITPQPSSSFAIPIHRRVAYGVEQSQLTDHMCRMSAVETLFCLKQLCPYVPQTEKSSHWALQPCSDPVAWDHTVSEVPSNHPQRNKSIRNGGRSEESQRNKPITCQAEEE